MFKNKKTKFQILEAVIPEIKSIRNKEKICCDSIRDSRLREELNKVFDKLNVSYSFQNNSALEGYDFLRQTILKDEEISPEEKISLIQKMQ